MSMSEQDLGRVAPSAPERLTSFEEPWLLVVRGPFPAYRNPYKGSGRLPIPLSRSNDQPTMSVEDLLRYERGMSVWSDVFSVLKISERERTDRLGHIMEPIIDRVLVPRIVRDPKTDAAKEIWISGQGLVMHDYYDSILPTFKELGFAQHSGGPIPSGSLTSNNKDGRVDTFMVWTPESTKPAGHSASRGSEVRFGNSVAYHH